MTDDRPTCLETLVLFTVWAVAFVAIALFDVDGEEVDTQ